MKIKKLLTNLTLSIPIAILLAAGVTFAAWQGTDWVQNGAIIDATYISDNFNYLYDQIGNGGASYWSKSGSKVYYNSGNVGIGTTAPKQKLTVTNGDSAVVNIYSNGGSVGVIDAVDPAVSSTGRWLSINPTGGNVGIGTTAPGAKLDVNGSIVWGTSRGTLTADQGASIELGGSGAPYIDFTNDASTDYDVRLQLNGNDSFSIQGGNVGIGITNPAAKLDVDAPSTTNVSLTWGATSGQIFRNENSEFAFGLENTSPYPLYIQGRTSSSAVRNIVINPLGGNVGIGTTNPGSRLHVNGGGGIRLSGDSNIYSTDWLRIYNGGSNLHIDAAQNLYLNYYTGSNVYFGTGVRGVTGVWKSNGNVGIGTTNPTAKLDVEGTLRANYLTIDPQNTASEGGELQLLNSNTEGNRNGKIVIDNIDQKLRIFRWRSNPNEYTEYAVFTPTNSIIGMQGNVGIGTTNPGAKLDVNGSVYATGFYYSSDENLKERITDIGNSRDILSVKPKRFVWKSGIKKGKMDIGIIAQDVEQYFPEFVREDEITGYKTVDYPKLVVPLIGVVKEQEERIKKLEEDMQQLLDRL